MAARKKKRTSKKAKAPAKRKAPGKRTTVAKRRKPAKGSKGGRPKIDLDWDAIGLMLRMGNTNEDLAALLKISLSTLQARFKENHEFVSEQRAQRRNNLRARQTVNALAGSDRMLEFLGIQELGQRHKHQISGEPGQPAVAVSIAEMAMLGMAHHERKVAEAAAARDDGEGT